MNLNNKSLLNSRRVEVLFHLCRRLELNDPPTAVGGIGNQKSAMFYQMPGMVVEHFGHLPAGDTFTARMI